MKKLVFLLAFLLPSLPVFASSNRVVDVLSDLSDTTISSPTNNQVLTYITADGKWENKTGGGGGGTWGSIAGTLSDQTDLQSALDAKAPTSRTLTAGAGLSGGGDLSANRSFATDSTKTDFLANGALTCGASTQGEMKVHTTPLQYCDNAATPALQYAAYGNSLGVSTSATILATARAIYGNNFDGSANLTQIIASTYGGTGNGFAKFSGPTTSEKTFTLPNASTTILTTNAAVTPAQGGTGADSSASTGFGTISSGTWSFSKAVPSGTVVGTSDSQALTNKDMSGAGNTFPTFNQNTSGSAATLTTARTIGGTSFNGSANIDPLEIVPTTTPADSTGFGIIVAYTYGESITLGAPLYFKSDGKVYNADANGSSTYPVIGIALATASSGSNNVLLYGIYQFASAHTDFTVGGLVYLSTTVGTLTQTQPTATDDVVQVVGVAVGVDTLLVKPSADYITHT